MKKSSILAILLISAVAAACSQSSRTGSSWGDRQKGGTIIGALGGAAIGSAFGSGSGKMAAVATGAILGGFVGNQIGASLDEEDRRRMEAAHFDSFNSGRSSEWRNPNTGRYGYVEVSPVASSYGPVCRNYTSTVYIEGRPEILRGQACRQSDGTWAPV